MNVKCMKRQKHKSKVMVVKVMDFFDTGIDPFIIYAKKKWHPAKTVVQVKDLRSGKIFNIYENQLTINNKIINDEFSTCCLVYNHEV